MIDVTAVQLFGYFFLLLVLGCGGLELVEFVAAVFVIFVVVAMLIAFNNLDLQFLEHAVALDHSSK